MASMITSIQTIGTPAARALLYGVSTRPLHRIVILAHNLGRAEAVNILQSQTLPTSEVQGP